VDFLASVLGETVVVKGQCLKSWTTICLFEAKVSSGKGTLSGYGTSKLVITGKQQSMDDIGQHIGSDKHPVHLVTN
jgi:hypothetical protein